MDYNEEFKILSVPHKLSKTYAAISQKETLLTSEKLKQTQRLESLSQEWKQLQAKLKQANVREFNLKTRATQLDTFEE